MSLNTALCIKLSFSTYISKIDLLLKRESINMHIIQHTIILTEGDSNVARNSTFKKSESNKPFFDAIRAEEFFLTTRTLDKTQRTTSLTPMASPPPSPPQFSPIPPARHKLYHTSNKSTETNQSFNKASKHTEPQLAPALCQLVAARCSSTENAAA